MTQLLALASFDILTLAALASNPYKIFNINDSDG